jgi:hypothetical protein
MATAFDPGVANYLAQAGDLTKLVFSTVANESAVSGWGLSRMLNKNPLEIEPVLDDLRDKQLLQSDGPGLASMYFLTQLGYQSRELL